MDNKYGYCFDCENATGGKCECADTTMDALLDYAEFTHVTAVYPTSAALWYVLGQMVVEAGEALQHVNKNYRNPDKYPIDKEELVLELGDVMYYWTRACIELGVSPHEVLAANVAKLKNRYNK